MNLPRTPYEPSWKKHTLLSIKTHTNTHKKSQDSTMEKNRRRKTHQMRCKKHPKHQQSPGVCSICLGEKLSQLSSASIPSSSRSKNIKVASVSSSSSLSSLSSHDSSSNASSCSSPMHHRMNNYRKGLEGKGYVSFLKVSGRNSVVLTKSRSMEFYPPRRDREIRVDDGKKKGGFWSKIIGSSRSKKMDNEGLLHSRTMRERFSTRVH